MCSNIIMRTRSLCIKEDKRATLATIQQLKGYRQFGQVKAECNSLNVLLCDEFTIG